MIPVSQHLLENSGGHEQESERRTPKLEQERQPPKGGGGAVVLGQLVCAGGKYEDDRSGAVDPGWLVVVNTLAVVVLGALLLMSVGIGVVAVP